MLDSSDDKLRHVACALGVSLKEAGVKEAEFLKIIESASDHLPAYRSICK